MQLARAGRYDEAMSYMERVRQRQGNTHFDFLALSAAETDPDTRAGLLQSFDRLLGKYPNDGQLLFGKALLLQQQRLAEQQLAVVRVLAEQAVEALQQAGAGIRVGFRGGQREEVEMGVALALAHPLHVAHGFVVAAGAGQLHGGGALGIDCLLYTSPSPRD